MAKLNDAISLPTTDPVLAVTSAPASTLSPAAQKFAARIEALTPKQRAEFHRQVAAGMPNYDALAIAKKV